MDREINERAVISTGAQRREVFHSDGGAAKLSVSVCMCVCVCTISACAFVYLCLEYLAKEERQTH